ncbi:uncharacterized protein [Notamacropus eugenii]|uniref:uncharacterized protein n=1 Tax=Notamacropus eugenii TaxID=9315 RepID=UPI003B66F5E6
MRRLAETKKETVDESTISSRENDSYRRPKDVTVNLTHPVQSLPVSKSLSRSTRARPSPAQREEGAGAGSGPENAYAAAIPQAKPVPQRHGERQLPPQTEGRVLPNVKKELELEVALRTHTRLRFHKPNPSLRGTVNDSSLHKQKVGKSDVQFSSTISFSDESTISSRENDSYRRPKDVTVNLTHPVQSLPVSKSLSRSTRARPSPAQREEGAGAGSGPENAYAAAIPQAKPVPQRHGERQLPPQTEDESTISCREKDSYRRPQDVTVNLNHPVQSLPVTKSLSRSIRTGLRPLQSEEGAGTGSGPKNAYRAVIPEAKPIAQIPGERQLPQKTEDASAINCGKKNSYRHPKDFTDNLNHPFQSLPVTKSLSGSTRSRVSPVQDSESPGAGSGSKNAYKAVSPEAEAVLQNHGEPQLPGKIEDASATSCRKKDSYRHPKDLILNLNHPYQSLPVTKNWSGSVDFRLSPILKDEAAGAGSVIAGAKQVPQKQGEPPPPVIIEEFKGSSEECSESFDKSDLQQDKVQRDANDHDDLIQSSDTAPEDYDLPPLNYPTIYLKIKDEVLRYDQSVDRKKSHCTLLARKVKNLENMISGMQKETSETIEMKSKLEHQKAECNRELCSIRFTLNQGKIKLETTKMLLEEHMEQLRREEEQYSKIVDLTQRLECSARSLEVELTTVRKHIQQVEEELKYTQRQLVHEQRARTLQESTLNNLLWKQKEKEAVASKATQTSEVPESNEKGKDLSDKNQILQDEVVMLKMELHRVKMELQGKENQFTEDTEVLKETIDELQKKLQLEEEALTKITSQYSGQLNVLTTENEVLNSKLEKAKRSTDRLETVIALYRSRLTSALHDHERSQISNPIKSNQDLEQTIQGERDELLRLQDELIHHLGSLRENNGVLSQKLWKAEGKTSSLEKELNCVHDSLREKTLTLETTQRELNQTQHKANELEHLNRVEKEKMDKYIFKHESIQKRLAQLENENVLLQQQLEDAQNKCFVKEKVMSESCGQFMDCCHDVHGDTGKQALMRKERNEELPRKYNYLREKVHKHKKEKAEIKPYTEREKLKKLTELNQSLENRLERELKRNEELEKELSGYKSLCITTNNKLREYEAIFSSLSSSSKLSSSSSSSPSSSSSSSS